jgi:hypothetical protein
MPLALTNTEWLNTNSLRSYPIAEWASRRDTGDEITFPNDVILSLYLSVHSGLAVEVENFYLSRIIVDADGFSLWVSYDDGSGPMEAASTAISFDGHEEFTTYSLRGLNDFFDMQGRITFGTTDAIKAIPAGVFEFTQENGRLDPDCVRPQIRGVSSVTVVNGNERSQPLFGIIEMVAGTNTSLQVIGAGGFFPQIIINAIKGEGLNKECVCTDIDHPDAPCVKSVGGVTADDDGNIGFISTDGIGIVPQGANALRFDNLFSRPCCKCPTLESLNRLIEQLVAGATVTNTFVTRLDATVQRLSLTVMGSRLNDRGCNTC